VHVPPRDGLAAGHQPRPEHEPRHPGLAERVLERPGGALRRRHPPVEGLLEAGDPAVGLRDHPRRRPLEQDQAVHGPGQLRDDLDRRRPGADHGDPQTGEVDVVPPPRGVEHRPLELGEAGHQRQPRLGERAGRADQDVRGQLAPRRRDPPARGVVLPAGRRDVGVEDDVPLEVEPPGHALQVPQDLRLPRERPRPGRVRRERERVEVGRDVAAAPGVGVLPPGAADGAAALQDHEVLDAHAPQPVRDGESREPGPDHRDPQVAAGRERRARRPGAGVRFGGELGGGHRRPLTVGNGSEPGSSRQ
jgi:hypothetical protein